MREAYATLGVEPGAGEEEVKAAFLRLAKLHHPDRNPGDPAAEERFKAVNAAHASIREALSKQEAAPRSPERAETRTQRRRSTPPEVVGEIRVTLQDAFTGSAAIVAIEALVQCTACDGLGGVLAGWRLCAECGGRGRPCVKASRNRHAGWRNAGCAPCGGRGAVPVAAPCPTCRGKGVRVARGRVPIVIPAGVDDGAMMDVRTQAGTIGAIRVRIRRKAGLERHGADLMAVRRVSPARAAKGTTVTVAGPDGARVRVRVPPLTAHGTVLRAASRGMPTAGRGRGDLLVRIDTTAKESGK